MSKRAEFVTKSSDKQQQFETGARRDSQDGKPRYDLIPLWVEERLAALLARGASHYGDWNWSKGIPVDRAYSSLRRHIKALAEGKRDEDHFAAAVFNLMVMEHSIHLVGNGLADLDLLGNLQSEPGINGLQEVSIHGGLSSQGQES